MLKSGLEQGNEDLSEQELIDRATEEYVLAMAKLPKLEGLDDEYTRHPKPGTFWPT